MIILKILAGVTIYCLVMAGVARFCGLNTMQEEAERERAREARGD